MLFIVLLVQIYYSTNSDRFQGNTICRNRFGAMEAFVKTSVLQGLSKDAYYDISIL